MVKNAIMYNESLEISPAMKKCSGEPYNPIFLETNDKKNLKDILSANNEEFVEYIHSLGLNVSYRDLTTNYQNISTTILTLKTTCFKVDFNDNFVKISPLK
ncbi:hypothetical protein GJV85_03755 [Sulfurimonas aquatica]|uniref:Uncharacterized protein n=1 Tax=Sulfurimonas aquatica TaxID=2672570 RepID=A0A975GE37_9BACT|nr:hypothetical protein GJV85_03755 [Sulfurimonas aquatica]